MATYQVRYVGPPSDAVPTATMLADTQGIDLTSSEPPAQLEGSPGSVVLVLTVEGSEEAVDAALGRVRAGLPPGATIEAG